MTRSTRSYVLAALALAGSLTLGACAGAPATPGNGQTPGVPGGEEARAQLCGTGPNSLQNTATGLLGVNQDTDEAQVRELADQVRQPLNDLQVTGAEQTARDAASTALDQLEAAMANPATRQTAATGAAGALRSLHDVLCQ
ncbi:MAG TPA: hypothetical protein VM305_09495 [Candidatus Limnocylindrales bacterium]|nr:hypothetical protein [Candidatus Limnocylindrales bacterium]